jgi:3-oxoacyl-[acyl-carrier-protein] synthase III
LKNRVLVAGVAMVPFLRPAVGDNLQKFADRALRLCLSDARIDCADIDLAFVASTSADQATAERIIGDAGIPGAQVLGISCANGSSALFLAREAVETGKAECVLVLGLSDWSVPDSQALGALLNEGAAAIRRAVAEITSSINMHEIGAETFARIAVNVLPP